MKIPKRIRFASLFASLVLVLSMLTSTALPIFAVAISDAKETLDISGDGEIDYLAIGSDATVGAGLGGKYNASAESSYPELVKKEIEASGKTVSFTQLAIPGIRAEELHYILDSSYTGDAYTRETFIDKNAFSIYGGRENLRKEYTEAIKNSEIITLEIGAQNFIGYGADYAFDGKILPNFDIFGQDAKLSIDAVKKMLNRALNGEPIPGSVKIDQFIERLVDGLTYAVVGYAVNFDGILEEIYKINPDAVVTVVNISNPFNGMDEIEVNLDNIDFDVPLSVIFGAAVEIANVYAAKLSAYSGRFNYAYVGEDGQTETFAEDVLAYNGTLSPEISEFLKANGATTVAAQDAAVKIMQMGIKHTIVDTQAVLDSEKDIYSIIDVIITAANSDSSFNLATNADYIGIVSDPALKSALSIAVRREFGSLITFPNAAGHARIADAVTSAFGGMVKGEDAFENSMNGTYADLLGDFDRDALLNLKNTLFPKYEFDKSETYYLAFGDNFTNGQNSYPSKIAQNLQGRTDGTVKYENLAHWSTNPVSLYNNLDLYKSEIAQADIITIGFNNARPMNDMFEQLKISSLDKFKKRPSYDWAAYIGEENVAELDKAIEELRGILVTFCQNPNGDDGLAEARADMLAIAVETYAFSYVSTIVTYPKLIEKISSIAKDDALIVVVGAYNDLSGRYAVLCGEQIPIGNYMQYLVDILNAELLLAAATNDNVAFVDSPKIETNLIAQNMDITPLKTVNPYDAKALLNFFSDLGDVTKRDSARPTEKGHTAAAMAILGKIADKSGHMHKYDNACDSRCDSCGNVRPMNNHEYEFVCSKTCSKCGEENISRSYHIYSAVCDDTCDVCLQKRSCGEHEFTGPCDKLCDACGTERAVSDEHAFGVWSISDGVKTRTCSSCGTVESEIVPSENTGWSAGAVIAVSAVSVIAVSAGGFSVFWFVIKKKTLDELVKFLALMFKGN